MEHARQENYFVLAKLNIGGSEILHVPCKIFLPEDVKGRIQISLRPRKEQYSILSHVPHASLYAEIVSPADNNHVDTAIACNVMYATHAQEQQWGPEISESFIEYAPQDMRITGFHHALNKARSTRVMFWISPNTTLSPTIMRMSSYRGSVDIKRSKQRKFSLISGIVLKFDRHFRSSQDKERFIQWSMLVAETQMKIAGIDIEGLRQHYLKSVDDFLLLASFGSRTRTACIGWTATDRVSYTRYFRRDISIPEEKPEPSLRDGLVSLADYEDFLTETYKAFCVLENKQPVRGAIYALVPGMDRSIEMDFLALFAGLEELVLDFRKRANLEYILADDWPRFRKYLTQAIKSWQNGQLSKEQRGWLYGQLNALNRVPLRAAFTRYCAQYHIDLSDLWPVFQEGGTFGLANIRNWLVHGAGLPEAAFDALIVATQHLRWTLERMVLGMLGWPVHRSEVSPPFLQRHATAIATMSDARSALAEMLHL